MADEWPAVELWLQLLADEVTVGRRADLESHLEWCTACLEQLSQLAAGGRPSPLANWRPAPALDPKTLAMLDRVAAISAAVRRSDDVTSLIPPGVEGLVDWEGVGRGGMGIVFRAREVDLDRPVAVKVFLPGGRLARSARGRAVREALLLASLRHPNVVQVYRSGEADGIPFLVMEWVDGGHSRSGSAGVPSTPARRPRRSAT